jgi:hypothetical protein
MKTEALMEKSLCLTEEEAMSLLDIVLVAPADLTPVQRSAFLKLAEHCRQFLKEEQERNAFPVGDPTPNQFNRYIS